MGRVELTAVAAAIALGTTLGGCAESETDERQGSGEPSKRQLELHVNEDGETLAKRSILVTGRATRGAAVRVNGDPARVDRGGRFSRRVGLDVGENDIVVKATLDGESDTETVQITRRRTARELAAIRERRRRARERRIAALRSQAVTIPYNQLEKNPDRHAGRKVTYRGQIFQIQEDAGITIILLAVTHDPLIDLWDDHIWVNYEGTIDSAEDDVITIYGEVVGTKSYETQIGGETYVPEVDAEVVEE